MILRSFLFHCKDLSVKIFLSLGVLFDYGCNRILPGSKIVNFYYGTSFFDKLCKNFIFLSLGILSVVFLSVSSCLKKNVLLLLGK